MSGKAEADRALAAADEALGRSDADGAVAHLSAAIRALTDDPCAAAMVCLRLGNVYGWRLGNLTASQSVVRESATPHRVAATVCRAGMDRRRVDGM